MLQYTSTWLLLWTLFVVFSFWSTFFRKLYQWSNVAFSTLWNWIADFYLSVKFTAWQKVSRWPLSKIIVLIKPRTKEEQRLNRRNFHDQDIAVDVLSSKVDGDCCKPSIQSGKAPPCFTSSTEFSGAMLSVCGQILRPVFVIPSYSDFQIFVEPHRLLAVCVCVCVWKIDTVYPLYKNDLCGNKIFPRCTVPLWTRYVYGLT